MRRLLFSLIAFTLMQATATNAAENIVLPTPEIEEPSAYVERKLKEFRDRLAALKEQRTNLGDEGPFDGAAAAGAILNSLSRLGPRDLVLTVNGDASVFDKLRSFDPGGDVFVRPIVLRMTTPFGPPRSYRGYKDELPFAVDAQTAAAFSMPTKAALTARAEVIILRPAGTCCVKFGTTNDQSGKRVCAQSVDVFKQEKQKIDLRSMLGIAPIGASLSSANIVIGDQGETISNSGIGPGSVTMTYTSGFQPTKVECGTRYNRSRNRREPVFVLTEAKPVAQGDQAVLKTRASNSSNLVCPASTLLTQATRRS